MLYDTTEKKIAFLKPGNVITMKSGNQHVIHEVRMHETVEVENVFGRTFSKPTIEDLLSSIDWEFMEQAHTDFPVKDYSTL